MSKTDKTEPVWVRKREFPIAHDHSTGECIIEAGGPDCMRPWHQYHTCTYDYSSHQIKWTNAEKGLGRGYCRWAKRMRSKKNRRRDVPHEKMRGYGWGEENYKLNW